MRSRPPRFVTFWLLVLPVLGAVAAYSAALRGGHTPPATMALVGAVWGGFIGALFSMEIAPVEAKLRRYIGAALGILASVISGLLLNWQVRSIVGVGLVAAVLGVFADLWVKRVTDLA